MSHVVEFSIGDETYEVTVLGWSAPTLPGREDPGDGGEVELEETVAVIHGGEGPYSSRPRSTITLDDFVVIFAADRKVRGTGWRDTLAAALSLLEDECLESAVEAAADDFDDRDV